MAYKRYFYRNGKRFGPYFYESYRDSNGKVKKRYVGTKNPDEEKDLKEKKSKQINLRSRFKLLLGCLILILILMDALFLVFVL